MRLRSAVLALYLLTPQAADAGERSAIQALVDAAAPGATVVVPPGTYAGDIVIDRPLRLVGRGRPLLLGAGQDSVVRVRAADVVVDGFDIDGRGGGDLGRDSSGIHVAAPRAIIRNCRILNSLFGVYLHQADGSRVEQTRIEGIPDKTAGEKGSGIHVWNTTGFTLTENTILYVRDGIYIQSSPHGVVRGNVAADLRYGLHYMYSDDNLFEDNRFENADAGTAIMYSRRIVFRRNAFLHNRGFASVGLLFKACDDVLAEDNLIADNARGVFLEGSARVTLRRNIIGQSDVAFVLYDSTTASRVEGNSFIGNMSPLMLVGRRTEVVFNGNYWSGHGAPDLDGDGRTDLPYRLSSLFDHLRGNVVAADLFSDSLALSALAKAEGSFPVLERLPVLDQSPLTAPPELPLVPRDRAGAGARGHLALAASLLLLGLGAGVWTPRRAG